MHRKGLHERRMHLKLDQEEDEDLGLDDEDDMPWKPGDFSGLNYRIQQRKKQAQPT